MHQIHFDFDFLYNEQKYTSKQSKYQTQDAV